MEHDNIQKKEPSIPTNISMASNFSRMSLQKRSLIRMIGSQLPLGSAQRPKFQALPNGSHVVCEDNKKNSLFSFSDIAQILDIPEIIGTLPVRHSVSSPDLTLHETVQAGNGMGPTTPTDLSKTISDEGVNNKISALEDELAQLRSQIAMLVSGQMQGNTSLNESTVSTGVPQITSTPIKSSTPSNIPPPPPPINIPPPPPPIAIPPKAAKPTMSVNDIVRQRKLAKSQSCVEFNVSSTPASVPSMSDVLKDMHKVKLRSVSRSPNGTPMNKNRAETIGNDPASLIAAALKKKFAHRKNFSDSPDKNDSGDFSTKHITPNKSINSNSESPEIPLFGQHLLRKRSSRKTTGSSLFKTERSSPIPECAS